VLCRWGGRKTIHEVGGFKFDSCWCILVLKSFLLVPIPLTKYEWLVVLVNYFLDVTDLLVPISTTGGFSHFVVVNDNNNKSRKACDISGG
jgi:hypothetical protein